MKTKATAAGSAGSSKCLEKKPIDRCRLNPDLTVFSKSDSFFFPFGSLFLSFVCFDWDVQKKFVAPAIQSYCFL